MRGLYSSSNHIRLIRSRFISSSIKIRLIREIRAQKNKISVRKDKIRVRKNKISVRKEKIRVQKDNICVPCSASPAIHVICVYVHAHTHAPACVYFIR